MADCGKSTYQALECIGLPDLAKAHIVRAEIGTIDRVAKTATVTLLDTCNALAWINETQIPFFYHCEHSTGTVEDLANGHKAFINGDIVFLVVRPDATIEEERAYIIGHVDIHDTYKCISDMLLVKITTPTIYFTIFDVGRGDQLDLANFQPVDEDSPAAPAALPALFDSGAAAWVAYNFENAVPATTVPCSFSLVQDGTLTDETSTTNASGIYNGTVFRSTSEGDACVGYNLGNESHYYSSERVESEIISDYPRSDYAVERYETNQEGHSPNTYHVGSGTGTCSLYWGDFSISTSYGYASEGNPLKLRIQDDVTSSNIDLPYVIAASVSHIVEFSCDGSSYDMTFVRSESVQIGFDFTSIGGSIIYASVSEQSSGAINGNGPGDGSEQLYMQESINASGSFLNGTGIYKILRENSIWESRVVVGADGVYAKIGSYSIVHRQDHITSVFGVNGYGSLGYQGWGFKISGDVNTGVGNVTTTVFSFNAPTVTLFDDTFNVGSPVSVQQCFSAADAQRTSALSVVLSSLVDSVVNAIGNDQEAIESAFSSFKRGPTFQVIKMKRV